MCIKMIIDDLPYAYDPDRNFLEQAKRCSEVIVEYAPDDEQIVSFLKEIQTCVKNGTNLNLNVRVNYGQYLAGFKTKKEIKQALSDINLNEIVKLMTISQHGAEKTLEELSSICLNREMNGK